MAQKLIAQLSNQSFTKTRQEARCAEPGVCGVVAAEPGELPANPDPGPAHSDEEFHIPSGLSISERG